MNVIPADKALLWAVIIAFVSFLFGTWTGEVRLNISAHEVGTLADWVGAVASWAGIFIFGFLTYYAAKLPERTARAIDNERREEERRRERLEIAQELIRKVRAVSSYRPSKERPGFEPLKLTKLIDGLSSVQLSLKNYEGRLRNAAAKAGEPLSIEDIGYFITFFEGYLRDAERTMMLHEGRNPFIGLQDALDPIDEPIAKKRLCMRWERFSVIKSWLDYYSRGRDFETTLASIFSDFPNDIFEQNW